ncbi:hypothetical protein ACYJ1Y_16905 [Natrialbaceae archaeon A-gly3]
MGTEDQTQRDERTEQEEVSQQSTPRAADESIVDLAQQPIVKQWTKFVAALFALVGVGLGLVVILFDTVDQDIVDGAGTLSLAVWTAPYIGVTLAVVVGVVLGFVLSRDDKTTFLAAAISSFVGSFVLLLLTAILDSTPSDASLDFGGLIAISITVGIAAAVVAAGGVWAVRNLAPDGVEITTRATEQVVHATDD